MPPILNAKALSKSFGAAPLFQNVSFVVNEGDRIGLIGPNGSGKSTLLRILGGTVEPDEGEVALRKRTRMSYVEQESQLQSMETVRSVVRHALERSDVPENERDDSFCRDTRARGVCGSIEAEDALPEDGASDWRSPRRWYKRPTSCCSTSRRTISTSPESSGSKAFSRQGHSPASS